MTPKKNPKKDLNKKSNVYFVFGLMLVLSLAYTALEWKTYSPTYIPDISLNNIDAAIDEEPPIYRLESLPPPPPIVPTKIEIIDDVDPAEETIIAATDPNQDTEILDPEKISVIEAYEPEPEVTWVTIEEVPVFPGCEDAEDKRACFASMIQKHIRTVFRYPEVEKEMGIEGRVNILFDIQKDGAIGGIRMRGPNKNLENEAARIISKLPKMTPGKQRHQNVKVTFAIPITFKLQ